MAITELRQLFDRLFTHSRGGNINPGFIIAYDGDRATIIENGYYALSKNNIYLYLKPIQHGEIYKMLYFRREFGGSMVV